jgi:hypothetical protein
VSGEDFKFLALFSKFPKIASNIESFKNKKFKFALKNFCSEQCLNQALQNMPIEKSEQMLRDMTAEVFQQPKTQTRESQFLLSSLSLLFSYHHRRASHSTALSLWRHEAREH